MEMNFGGHKHRKTRQQTCFGDGKTEMLLEQAKFVMLIKQLSE